MPGIEARAPERTETSSGLSGSPKLGADRLLDRGQRRGDLVLQLGRVGLAVVVVVGADLGGDREAGRHRQAELLISARLAPLPPSRFFISARPSALPSPKL